MKIVVNRCFGGFSLSPAAIKRFAEIKGRPCYFFRQEHFMGPYIAVPDLSEASDAGMLIAFDISNPNETLADPTPAAWQAMTAEEKQTSYVLYKRHVLDSRPDDRCDVDLIRTVEELGCEESSGKFAKLKIIEIPDDIEWELEEYDGLEIIHEKHKSWS